MEDHEKFYDEEIAPALAELGRRCEARGMSFLACCQYSDRGFGSTSALTSASFAMRLVHGAIQARGNIDALLFAVVKHLREDRAPHSSMWLAQALHPDPAKRAAPV